MGQIELHARKYVINHLIELVVGIVLKNKVEVFWRCLKLNMLNGNEMYGMLEEQLKAIWIGSIKQGLVDEVCGQNISNLSFREGAR